MRPEDALGRAFRAGLRRELPKWREDGIVDDDAVQRLTERYALDAEGGNLAATAIYVFGSILIFGGIVTCLGWNWDGFPDWLKLALNSALLGCAFFGGHWLWQGKGERWGSGNWPRLGHSLCFFGSLLIIAEIALAAETFDLGSGGVTGLIVWAVCMAGIAWWLRSVPIAVVSVIVIMSAGIEHVDHYPRVDRNYWVAPYGVALWFAALHARLKSPVLFAATAVCMTTVMGYCAGEETNDGAGFALATIAIANLLLTFSLSRRRGSSFGPWAAVCGMAGYTLVAFIASFHDGSREFRLEELLNETFWWVAYVAPVFAATLGLGVAALWRDWRVILRRPAHFAAVVGGIALLDALMVDTSGTAGAIVANVGLLVVAVASITTAARTLSRAPFWFGVLLAGILALTRFVEFDVEEWVKAAAFIACGIAVIAFGIFFEKRRKGTAAVAAAGPHVHGEDDVEGDTEDASRLSE